MSMPADDLQEMVDGFVVENEQLGTEVGQLREALEKVREIVCDPASCCFPTLTTEDQAEVNEIARAVLAATQAETGG